MVGIFGLGAMVVRAREMFTAEGRCEVPDAGGNGVGALCADGVGGLFPWKIPREESRNGERSVVYGLTLGGTQDVWETFSCFLIQEEGAH